MRYPKPLGRMWFRAFTSKLFIYYFGAFYNFATELIPRGLTNTRE